MDAKSPIHPSKPSPSLEVVAPQQPPLAPRRAPADLFGPPSRVGRDGADHLGREDGGAAGRAGLRRALLIVAVAGGPLAGRDGNLLWGLLPGLHPCGASTGWEMGEEVLAEMGTSRRCSGADLRGLTGAMCCRGGSAWQRWHLQHSPASNPGPARSALSWCRCTLQHWPWAKQKSKAGLWLVAGSLH